MKVGILQLSDIHIKNENDFILTLSSKIASSVYTVSHDVKKIIILVSGDIAFSGQKEEYALALTFFNKLYIELIENIKNVDLDILLVPGNHDCNFNDAVSYRDDILNSIKENYNNIPQDKIDVLTDVQKNFFDFESKVTTLSSALYSNKLLKQYNIGSDILVNSLNTAWMSSLHEKKGELFYDEKIIPTPDFQPQLRISFFHHPFSWFSSDTERRLRQCLASQSDIILTGHEHVAENTTIKSNDNTFTYINGGILSDSKDSLNSTFIYLKIDIQSNKLTKFVMRFNGEFYTKEQENLIENFSFGQNKDNLLASRSYLEYLADAGAEFKHPYKERLFLQDIFVYPHLKKDDFEIDGKQESMTICSSKVEDFLLRSKKLLITGEDQAGKTTLLKAASSLFLRSEIYPCFIDCCKIKRTKFDNIKRNILELIQQQYEDSNLDKYLQMEKKKRAFIIDNFDKLVCKNDVKIEFLSYIEYLSDVVIISCNNLFNIEGFIKGNQSNIQFLEYEKRGILPLTKSLRESIIDKWLSLSEETSTNNSFYKDQFSSQIDNFMRNNIIPSYPIYTLIAIQQLSMNMTMTDNNATIGKMYEYLISEALLKLNISLDRITIENYLEEFSFQMFNKKIKVMTCDDLSLFHKDYCSRYGEELDRESIFNQLARIRIIKKDGDSYSFKYKYYYYYFISRHLSRKMTSDPSIRDQIEHMTKHIYIDEYAQILIFLTYLSDFSDYIISLLLKQSQKIYEKYTPSTLSNELDFINNLSSPALMLKTNTLDGNESRKKVLEKYDEIENSHNLQEHDNIQMEEVEEINEILMLTVSFKTLEILGQVLKNYSGKFDKENKIAITSLCYDTCFKIISFISSTLESNIEELTSDLTTIIKEKNNVLSDKEVNEKVNKFIYSTFVMMTLAIIKKTSFSIGIERLRLTYKEILTTNSNIANKLLDISIKYDSFKDLPVTEVKELSKSIEKNRTAKVMLALMTQYRFEMRVADSSQKQQIYSALELAPSIKSLNPSTAK